MLEVFTDGSYSEQTSGVGFAGCGVWFGPLDPRNMSFHLRGPEQTNNRAELSASIAALRAVPVAQPLRVVTDSKHHPYAALASIGMTGSKLGSVGSTAGGSALPDGPYSLEVCV